MVENAQEREPGRGREGGGEERPRTSLHCECLKSPLGHGVLTEGWHVVMCSIQLLHYAIHFLFDSLLRHLEIQSR